MKVAVATIERFENRARPQIPWPLVQPDPKVDPAPTMKPATIVVDMLAGKPMLLQSFSPSAPTMNAPSGNPSMNAKRHNLPDGYAADTGDTPNRQH